MTDNPALTTRDENHVRHGLAI